MGSVRAWFVSRFYRITESIAFWPGLIAVAFMIFAITFRSIGQDLLGPVVGKVAPFLLIKDGEVALSLLTMITGGLISLMVFSFSMVMVLLSNATSNLSPRLLPSLIGSKNHQIVLGFYLGTIIFNIIVAMGFGLSNRKSDFPSVAVAVAVILGIICLAMFVYFIHTVSRSIQVGVVLSDVHERTITAIESIEKRNGKVGLEPPKMYERLPKFASQRAGFFQGVDNNGLAAFAKRHEITVYIDKLRGKHVLEGDNLLMYSAVNDTEDISEYLQDYIQLNSTELTSRYYVHGVTRIVEVAIKALSPGINDPGTALTSIDYLTEIFDRAISLADWEIVVDDNEDPRVWLRMEKWSSLLYRHVLSIYNYGKEDYAVCQRLVGLLKSMDQRIDSSDTEKKETIQELLKIVEV